MSEYDRIEYLKDIIVSAPLSTIMSGFTVNMQRINGLMTIVSMVLESQGLEYRDKIDDILRATVVLLHASLEDALREIARLRLGQCSAEDLDTIPLKGVSLAGQPKKFSLGNLSRHRGKTVNELIQESVDDFLDHYSFNSTDDIADILNKSGIDLSDLREHFVTLDEMISRRHQIVHKADRIGTPDSWSFAPIESSDILNWATTGTALLAKVCLQMVVLEAPPEIQMDIKMAMPKVASEILAELGLESLASKGE